MPANTLRRLEFFLTPTLISLATRFLSLTRLLFGRQLHRTRREETAQHLRDDGPLLAAWMMFLCSAESRFFAPA